MRAGEVVWSILPKMSQEIEVTFSCGGKRLDFTPCHPALMGILNVTPDSFSDGGDYVVVDKAVAHGLEMVAAGAEFIDVGGESTRPGFTAVEAEEEIRRVVPVIAALRKKSDVIISIDTNKAVVAAAALAAGADVVNDVTGLRDPDMPAVIREYKAGCVLMDDHKLNADERTPAVVEYLRQRLDFAMAATGLPLGHFLVDPGIGFGKTPEQNLEIVSSLSLFRQLGCGVLLGVSRKSFLVAFCGEVEPPQRDPATFAIGISCRRDAQVLRVHNVAGQLQALRAAIAVQG